jgi:hypothetical protein
LPYGFTIDTLFFCIADGQILVGTYSLSLSIVAISLKDCSALLTGKTIIITNLSIVFTLHTG